MNVESFSSWNSALAWIAARGPCEQSIDHLLKSLERLVGGCNSMSILYPKGERAVVTHSRLRAAEDPKLQVGGYTDAAYLLDPFYTKAIKEGLEGVFRLKDVSPEGFEDSEYFNLYYRRANLEDEVCFIFILGNGAIASLSICRSSTSKEKPFSEREVQILNAVFPIVRYIITEYLGHLSEEGTETLESQLDQALASFGQAFLTPKECEILHYILQGYSLKSISSRLGNSLETIKYHRKNIYKKLDVTTQPELFYLFIDSLRYKPASGASDPLVYYFNKV